VRTPLATQIFQPAIKLGEALLGTFKEKPGFPKIQHFQKYRFFKNTGFKNIENTRFSQIQDFSKCISEYTGFFPKMQDFQIYRISQNTGFPKYWIWIGGISTFAFNSSACGFSFDDGRTLS
jgi:hypothetical protein